MKHFLKSLLFGLLVLVSFAPANAALPEGYTELKYIESSGTQYINTGVKLTSTNGVYLEFAYDTYVNDNQILGTDIPNNIGNYNFYVDTYNYSFYYCSGGTRTNHYIAGADFTGSHSMGINYMNSGKWVVDGRFITNTTTITTNDYNLLMFRRGTTKTSKVKIKKVSISNNTTLTHEFIPARRNSDGELGMYDTVNNRFYTNDGTGEFVAGPVVDIKIATTNYVTREFAPVQTRLTQTNTKITNLITQSNTNTASIATLAAQKQNRPATNCPTGKKCLLVKDINGNDNWYPIIDMVLLSNIIGTDEGSAGAYVKNDGTFSGSINAFGLTSSNKNSFAVAFGNNGFVRGHGRCSTRAGTNPWITNTSYTVADSDIVSTLADETGQDGALYCYCQLDDYTPSGGTAQKASSKWFYVGSRSDCAGQCSGLCPYYLRSNSSMYLTFRSTFLNGIKVAQ